MTKFSFLVPFSSLFPAQVFEPGTTGGKHGGSVCTDEDHVIQMARTALSHLILYGWVAVYPTLTAYEGKLCLNFNIVPPNAYVPVSFSDRGRFFPGKRILPIYENQNFFISFLTEEDRKHYTKFGEPLLYVMDAPMPSGGLWPGQPARPIMSLASLHEVSERLKSASLNVADTNSVLRGFTSRHDKDTSAFSANKKMYGGVNPVSGLDQDEDERFPLNVTAYHDYYSQNYAMTVRDKERMDETTARQQHVIPAVTPPPLGPTSLEKVAKIGDVPASVDETARKAAASVHLTGIGRNQELKFPPPTQTIPSTIEQQEMSQRAIGAHFGVPASLLGLREGHRHTTADTVTTDMMFIQHCNTLRTAINILLQLCHTVVADRANLRHIASKVELGYKQDAPIQIRKEIPERHLQLALAYGTVGLQKELLAQITGLEPDDFEGALPAAPPRGSGPASDSGNVTAVRRLPGPVIH